MPAPNSSKTGRSIPSEYNSNGTGRCWNRTNDPNSLLSSRVPGPNTRTAPGVDLASADTSRLIRTPGRRPNMPAAGQEEVQRRHRVLDVGGALQDAAALAQHGDQLAPFPPGGEGRRQRTGAEAVTVEFVDGRVHPGHAEKPGVERLFEHRGHLVEFGVGRAHAVGGGAVEAEHRGTQVRMPEHAN